MTHSRPVKRKKGAIASDLQNPQAFLGAVHRTEQLLWIFDRPASGRPSKRLRLCSEILFSKSASEKAPALQKRLHRKAPYVKLLETAKNLTAKVSRFVINLLIFSFPAHLW